MTASPDNSLESKLDRIADEIAELVKSNKQQQANLATVGSYLAQLTEGMAELRVMFKQVVDIAQSQAGTIEQLTTNTFRNEK